MRLLELLMDRSLQVGTRKPLVILIGISCGTHGHLASHLPYLSLCFFK